MTDSLYFAGIDGWSLPLADYYAHDFWEEIRDDVLVLEIPKPGQMESGDIATASSPRLWGRIYTGCEPHTNGILGFWEKLNDDGDVVRSNVSQNWLMENRCEKLVMADDLRVPAVWDVIADAGRSIGLTAPWFTYPLSDDLKAAIDEHGYWALSDFPFPMDHEYMDRDRMAHPPEAWPGEDFLEEVGAGMRTPILAKEDPWGFYTDLLQSDQDRYEHVAEQLVERTDPEEPPAFTTTLTRATDALAHKFRNPSDIMDHYPDDLQDPIENFRRVYDLNFDKIAHLDNVFDFDHLVIGGDHGCGYNLEDGELTFPGDDHEWPAWFAIRSPAVEGGQTIRASYEDIMPTILDLLGVEIPDHVEGTTLVGQAAVEKRLKGLGYAP